MKFLKRSLTNFFYDDCTAEMGTSGKFYKFGFYLGITPSSWRGGGDCRFYTK